VKQKLKKGHSKLEITKQLLGLLGDQPNIPIKDLSKIKAKVLIIAGDEDIIKTKHSLEMYENIPKLNYVLYARRNTFRTSVKPEII
jgi:pimeloyl-ACP methyl ester carboxylesterase